MVVLVQLLSVQAAEFDYAEIYKHAVPFVKKGYKVVLVNSKPATIYD